MPGRRHSAMPARLAAAGAKGAIVDQLRRVILDGGALPGSPIPVNEVAEVLGVSPIPVRESLKTLTAEGLVTHHPNVGYTVARLTASELSELYLVRATLESAALAAAVTNATEPERASVATAHRMLERAVAEDDPQAYHRQSRHFHIGMARPSGMHRLVHMLESAWNITEPVQAMVHVGHADRVSLHADHGEMLEAFLDRDAEALLAVSGQHHRRLNDVVATLPPDTGLITRD
ncbi:GntR family transcriptional regulator [Mycolicibacterium arenosum]|uniref:GntR family transcriptional regulator n=1 Tax=Mycolicibacterium arenosum TaxID=2952157 RepID=A0ABT1MAY4_9MYCO|nr:GntR family transcriptional regulator [Mycolicibacterium sp. CAU 1645]MCP9275700.1 GntR family transcriptional regulator [Mycolicibacterium sp. CAU 1645]